MEVRGIEPEDLVGAIGSVDVVSGILNEQQNLSAAQVKALADFFHVSPELFVPASTIETMTLGN
jgi:HTH-type transcriptional regulator/antitoxin HigA